MEQMNTDGLTLVSIDFDAEDTPASVKRTHPVLYVDGDGYSCLLGPDPASGIYGHGKAPKDALKDFDRHFQDRLEHPMNGDPVADFIQQRHI